MIGAKRVGPSTGAHANSQGATHRQIAQWRRVTARIAILVNRPEPEPALAAEAFALQRQCERLAVDLHDLGERVRQDLRQASAEVRLR